MIQVVYFLLIGWWCGAIVGFFGYLLCATLILLPFGVLILNRLPTVVFLKEVQMPREVAPGTWAVHDELPWIIRAIWFFLLGWELGIFVFVVGYIFILTLIGMPIGIFLLNRLPLVLTLSQRYRAV